MKIQSLFKTFACFAAMFLSSCLFQPTDAIVAVALTPYPPQSNVSIKVISDRSGTPLYEKTIEANTRYTPSLPILREGSQILYQNVEAINATITVITTMGSTSSQQSKTVKFKLDRPYPVSFVVEVDVKENGMDINCSVALAPSPCEQP